MYLLDTHAFIWLLSDRHKVPKTIQKKLAEPEIAVFVSSVSIWEMLVKAALNKLTFPFERLEQEIQKVSLRELPLTISHAQRQRSLPKIHRDPFDRMLICQALVENLTLVTNDSQISQYPVKCAW